jgi:hypothetical protein
MTTTTPFTLTTTNFNTGCVSEAQMLLTVTGGVLICFISASPLEVCMGAQTHLQAQAYGGTGEYTYSWTSSPPGFVSDLRDPMVAPDMTTTYYLSVNDGDAIITNNIEITVHPLPVPEAGTNQIITYGTPTTLMGGASQGTGPYLYQWEPSDKLVSANVQNPTTLNLYESTVFTLYVTDQGTDCVCEQPDFVTVAMEGDALSAHPAAQPDTICSGTSSNLFTLAGGGTNNYTYQWTSDPPGFSSNLANPEVSPSTTTVYTVSVNDGFNATTAQVTVTVNQVPQINLLPVGDPRVQIISPTEIGICVFDTINLDAGTGNPGYTYLWSNGSLDQIISIQTSGLSFDLQEFDVSVTNQATGCTGTSHIVAFFTFLNCSYGIDDKDYSNNLRVYPNPSANGLFNYTIEGLDGEAMLEVYTSQGKLNHKEIISLIPGNTFSSNLDLGQYAPGVYYLKLSCNDTVIVKKLIIQ